MQIQTICPKKWLSHQLGETLSFSCSDYFLLKDNYFDIGVAYYQNNQLIKKVYFPLSEGFHDFKKSFILAEIIEKKDCFFIRFKTKENIEIKKVSKDLLYSSLAQNSRFYTAFCVEEEFLDHPWHQTHLNAFSLLYLGKEAPKNEKKISQITIIADPAQNLENAYQEGKALYDFLKQWNLPIDIQLYAYSLKPSFLEEILRQSQVVHFCGHISEKGLCLGKDYYSFTQGNHKLPPFLFLNGCQLPRKELQAMIYRDVANCLYQTTPIEDHAIPIEKIQYFYLGLLLGYRIGDCARKTIDFQKTRLYGWMTNRYGF